MRRSGCGISDRSDLLLQEEWVVFWRCDFMGFVQVLFVVLYIVGNCSDRYEGHNYHTQTILSPFLVAF